MWQNPPLQPPYYFKAPPKIPIINSPHPRGPSVPPYRSSLNPYSIPFTPPQVRFSVELDIVLKSCRAVSIMIVIPVILYNW